MGNFENDGELYALAVRLSHAIDSSDHPYGGAEIILLAQPTYLETGYSVCPLTSLDGQDLIDEDRLDRERIHVLHDEDRARILSEWKTKPTWTGDFKQIVAMTEESARLLLLEGFGLVRPCLDFIKLPAYEFNGKAHLENLVIGLRQQLGTP